MEDCITTLFRLDFKGLMIIVVCASSKDQIIRLFWQKSLWMILYLQGMMIVLAEIFVDDTLFTGNDDQCKEFLEKMNKELEMSMF